MIKKVCLILLLLITCGCKKDNKFKQSDDIKRTYLTEKYYGSKELIDSTIEDVNNNTDTYILFTYNSFCNMSKPCEDIFKSFVEKYNISFLSIPFDKFKETYLYETVKYGPSIIIVDNKKVISYLDAEKDDDIEKYQELDAFEKWLDKYIYFEKEK